MQLNATRPAERVSAEMVTLKMETLAHEVDVFYATQCMSNIVLHTMYAYTFYIQCKSNIFSYTMYVFYSFTYNA